jgi:hypothetical protein
LGFGGGGGQYDECGATYFLGYDLTDLTVDDVYVLVAGVVIVDGTTNRELGVLITDGTVTLVAGVVVTVETG